MGRQVVIAGPESSQNDVSAGLLLWELCDVVTEGQVNAVVVPSHHIRPDAEQNVLLFSNFMVDVHTGLVAL